MDQEVVQLLRKYISNNCNAIELEKVSQIMLSGSFEQEWQYVLEEEAALDMAVDSPVNDSAFQSEKVLNKINSTINPAPKFKIQPWFIGIAAALLLTLSIGYLFLNNRSSTINNTVLLRLTSPAGKQKKVTLDDGTQVILNCGSTLTYAAHFEGNKREVYLNGEAFFDVKHDDQKPFLVHTGRLNVQVLGTSFNVRSYHTDARAIVSVASGKVGVNSSKAAPTYMLLPGDQLSYNRKNEVKSARVSSEEILAWQKGILIFHLETIREIVPVLERYYGVNITVHRNYSPYKQVTASFTRKTLPEVLEILSQTSGFKYTIDKNQVFIN